MKKIKNVLLYLLPLKLIDLMTGLLPNCTPTTKIRGILYRPFFKKCGKNFAIAQGTVINGIWNIEIGDNVYIAHNCWINGIGGLIINENVILSPMVVVATTKHEYETGFGVKQKSDMKQIEIGGGTWISSNTVICAGVKVGKNCIVGAGSVVTKDIENSTFACGQPAKIKRRLI